MHTKTLPARTDTYGEQITTVEYDIPDGETPAMRCPYCDRPFRTERLGTFHIGVRHADECTDAERERFDEERDDEEFDLFTFHAKAAVSVFLTYFMFTFLYALIWA
ncbi:hypothetical protein OB955_10805 [Halobacteria archaeon AArc-m2/3/4]|uniref:C2H2-type domain-containing protein n=1 Tax=Natronoglomus mannanivorans TaxID=2979990 RepID=A0AAP2YYC1_9EURY|nr:hypothetical protein [Halobacteria archaeon AArc-xg1-1]MCU4973232.1 hypothetical protein [Halobacteria archaeon AArc-m2/3/4]